MRNATIYHCPDSPNGLHAYGYGEPLDARPGRTTALGTCEHCGHTVKFHTPKAKRPYVKPDVSPACTPTGYDVSTLAWMDRTGLDYQSAPLLWESLGDLLQTMVDAETMVVL